MLKHFDLASLGSYIVSCIWSSIGSLAVHTAQPIKHKNAAFFYPNVMKMMMMFAIIMMTMLIIDDDQNLSLMRQKRHGERT